MAKLRKIAITAGFASLALVGNAMADKSWTLTEQEVKKACGNQLQSSGGSFGCTKGGNGSVRDYGCNSDPKNGNVGCREIVFTRTAPKLGKGQVITGSGGATTGGDKPIVGRGGGLAPVSVGGSMLTGSGVPSASIGLTGGMRHSGGGRK
jgi:hypothetical protein